MIPETLDANGSVNDMLKSGARGSLRNHADGGYERFDSEYCR